MHDGDERDSSAEPVEQPVRAGQAGQPTGQLAGQATGHPAVDAVLASLDGLDGRPVQEHVEVVEQAHEALRRVLDEASALPESDGTPSAGEA